MWFRSLTHLPLFKNKQSKDLNYNVKKLLQAYHKTCKLIVNEVWRETQFKIINRTYLPFLIDTVNSVNSLCPWRGFHCPTLFHCFWSCIAISSYWDQVLNYIFGITTIQFIKDHWLCLFGHDVQRLSLNHLQQEIFYNGLTTISPNYLTIMKDLKSLLYMEKLDIIVQ